MNKLLIETLQNQDGYRSYSGRGMYGSECVGITCTSATETLMNVVSDMLDNLNVSAPDDQETETVITNYDTALEEMKEAVELLKEARTDSMGLKQILYFPDIEYPDAESEENDSDEDE